MPATAQVFGCRAVADESNFDSANRVIDVVKEALDDEEISAAFQKQPKLMKAMDVFVETNNVAKIAAYKIDAIISALRTFARLDEAEVEECDLHEGIESALVLLTHELGDRIEVTRDYGDLPPVECRGREINQVFMNILSNAIGAIEREGSISISTRSDKDNAIVRIADTGRGIPPEDHRRIFDPGFTTKGRGVSLGLGLPIAYSIIQSHKGSIEVDSKAERGTCFTVTIPARYRG